MNKIIASFAAALALTFAAASYSDSVQADLRDNIVRLHIIADSDSEADQAVKLKVRDAVLSEIGEKLKSESVELCKENISGNLNEIEKIADRVLAENGFTYTSRAYYGKFDFPAKSYSNITLPAGEYYGVRVVLGSGGGKNWWCVLYPPMCMTESGGSMDTEEKIRLKESLDAGTYDVITGNGKEIVVKFKIVDIAQEIKQLVSGTS